MVGVKRQIPCRALCAACVIGVLGFAGLAQQSKPRTETKAQAHTMTKQEQDAVKVVAAWEAAFMAGDADKMGGLMAEDCEFRADPREAQLSKGRAAFMVVAKRLTGGGGQGGPRNLKITPGATYAVASQTGMTVILRRRVDSFTLRGQPATVPVVAFFRVKDGEIQEWMDIPLIDVRKLFPRPPAGSPGGPSAGAPRTPTSR